VLSTRRPLVGSDLPEEFATLRRLIEVRMGKRGKREFVQVLRLLELFPKAFLVNYASSVALPREHR
jgi:hypothetical protein